MTMPITELAAWIIVIYAATVGGLYTLAGLIVILNPFIKWWNK